MSQYNKNPLLFLVNIHKNIPMAKAGIITSLLLPLPALTPSPHSQNTPRPDPRHRSPVRVLPHGKAAAILQTLDLRQILRHPDPVSLFQRLCIPKQTVFKFTPGRIKHACISRLFDSVQKHTRQRSPLLHKFRDLRLTKHCYFGIMPETGNAFRQDRFRIAVLPHIKLISDLSNEKKRNISLTE